MRIEREIPVVARDYVVLNIDPMEYEGLSADDIASELAGMVLELAGDDPEVDDEAVMELAYDVLEAIEDRRAVQNEP